MKTKITHFAAIAFFALFILAGNVNAKGTEKSASSLENIEATLELENWMVNDNLWDTGGNFNIEPATEASIELENWMTNENIWGLENAINLETETEQDLEFEPWMTNENIWNK